MLKTKKREGLLMVKNKLLNRLNMTKRDEELVLSRFLE